MKMKKFISISLQILHNGHTKLKKFELEQFQENNICIFDFSFRKRFYTPIYRKIIFISDPPS